MAFIKLHCPALSFRQNTGKHQMLKRTQTILFIILACGIYFLTYLQVDSTFFLYGIAQWVLYLVFGIMVILVVYRLITDKRPISLLKKSQSLFIGLLFTLSFLILEYLVVMDGGKKVVLSAGNHGDLYLIHLDLRSDNTFKLINSGPFGGTIYRGNYKLQKDTLQIDNAYLKYLYPTLTFAVKISEYNKKYFDPVNPDTTKFRYPLYFHNTSR